MTDNHLTRASDEPAPSLTPIAEPSADIKSAKKRRLLPVILFSVWGVLCALSAALGKTGILPNGFPFEPIGKGLRAMSLSGNVGNVFAIVIFSVICLIPVVAFAVLRVKSRTKSDWLLLLCAVQLVPTLYFSVNPGLIYDLPGMPMTSVAILSATFWSEIIAWLVLRLCLTGSSEKQRYRILGGICYAIMALLIYSCCFHETSTVISALRSLREGNTAPSVAFFVTATITVIKGLLDIIPTVFVFACFVFAVRLLDALKADKFSSLTITNAAKLAKLSRVTLCVSMLLCVASNIMQLLLSRYLLTTSYSVILPLGLAAISLILLLFADYVSEGAKMKRDNSLFI